MAKNGHVSVIEGQPSLAFCLSFFLSPGSSSNFVRTELEIYKKTARTKRFFDYNKPDICCYCLLIFADVFPIEPPLPHCSITNF